MSKGIRKHRRYHITPLVYKTLDLSVINIAARLSSQPPERFLIPGDITIVDIHGLMDEAMVVLGPRYNRWYKVRTIFAIRPYKDVLWEKRDQRTIKIWHSWFVGPEYKDCLNCSPLIQHSLRMPMVTEILEKWINIEDIRAALGLH